MKRKLVLIPLYLLFFAGVFLLAFFLLLPWDRMQQMVASRVEAATGYHMTADEFSSYWLTGFEASNVVLAKPLTASEKAALAAARRKAQTGKGSGAGSGSGAAGAELGGNGLPGEDEAAGLGGMGDEELAGGARPHAAEEITDVPLVQPAADGDEDRGGGNGDAERGSEPGAGSGSGAGPARAPRPVTTPPIVIPQLNARVAILPLLIGRIVVDFQADLAGGSVRGSVGRHGEDWHLELDAQQLRLAALPMIAQKLKVPLKGTVSLSGDLLFAPKEMGRTKGKFLLALAGAELGAGEIPLPKGSVFPTYELSTPTKIGTLKMNLVIGEEEARDANAALAHIASFEHKGEDLEFKAEGDVVLLPELGQSRPDMTLGVRFAEPFVQRNHLAMVLNTRDVKRYLRDDFLGLTLRGTIAHLDPRLAAPAWGKSRPYLRVAPGTKKAPPVAGKQPATGPAAKGTALRPGGKPRPGLAGRSGGFNRPGLLRHPNGGAAAPPGPAEVEQDESGAAGGAAGSTDEEEAQ